MGSPKVHLLRYAHPSSLRRSAAAPHSSGIASLASGAFCESIRYVDLGLMDFHAAFALQERLVAAIAAGDEPETLLLVEHHPVYTIGSGGDGGNVLDPAIEAIRINRGGDVTYHGPGQLVGYPLLDLDQRGRDLHRYLRLLEELLIGTASDLGVSARRIAGKTGVWTEKGKLASIGVGVRRWVTMHGFALNVAPDVGAFGRINPCGMVGCPITSLADELGVPVQMERVKAAVEDNFRGIWGR